jgi:hypothetical protein
MTHLFMATFPYFTNLPEDVVVNTWHFKHALDSPADDDAIAEQCARLAVFYNEVYRLTGCSFAAWCPVYTGKIKVYNLADPTPRPPIHTMTPLMPNSNQ